MQASPGEQVAWQMVQEMGISLSEILAAQSDNDGALEVVREICQGLGNCPACDLASLIATPEINLREGPLSSILDEGILAHMGDPRMALVVLASVAIVSIYWTVFGPYGTIVEGECKVVEITTCAI